MTLFVDGNVNYPSCRCTSECEMPCWQLYGLTDEPCGACGCAPFEFKPAVVSKGAVVSGQEAKPQAGSGGEQT